MVEPGAAAGEDLSTSDESAAGVVAFGKSQPEEQDAGGDANADYQKLTRAQRAALIALVLEEEEKQRKAAGESSDPRPARAPAVPVRPN